MDIERILTCKSAQTKRHLANPIHLRAKNTRATNTKLKFKQRGLYFSNFINDFDSKMFDVKRDIKYFK